MPRGRGGFGRGYGYFGPRFGRGIGSGWFGWGRGFGNPYPFCRWFPWLPRRWWAYPAYGLPYTGYYSPYYGQYLPNPYMMPYPYPSY